MTKNRYTKRDCYENLSYKELIKKKILYRIWAI